MSESRLESIEAAVQSLSERLDRLEGHRLPERVAVIEAGVQRMERQLELVFAQGQANSKSQGESRALLERVEIVMQQILTHVRGPG